MLRGLSQECIKGTQGQISLWLAAHKPLVEMAHMFHVEIVVDGNDNGEKKAYPHPRCTVRDVLSNSLQESDAPVMLLE